MDDFDSPNTKSGLCPECGQPATIWLAIANEWECTYCSWSGRQTKQPVDNGSVTKIK